MADSSTLINSLAISNEITKVVNDVSLKFNDFSNNVTQNIMIMGNELEKIPKKVEPLSTKFSDFGAKVSDSFGNVNALITSVDTLATSIGSGIQSGVTKAKGFLDTYINSYGELDTALMTSTLKEEAFAKAAEFMADPLGSIGNTVSGLGDTCMTAIDNMTAIIGGVEAIQAAYAALKGSTLGLDVAMEGVAVTGTEAVMPAFSAFGTTILPIIGVIALITLAIAGLTLGFQYLYENSVTFRDTINGIFTSIQTHVEGIIGGIVTIISTLYSLGIQPIIESTKAAFTDLWENGLSAFIENISIFALSFIEMILSIWDNALNPFINLCLEILLPIFTTIWDAILAIVVPVIEKIMEYVNMFMEVLNIAIALLNEHVWPIFKVVFDGLSEIVRGFWEFISPIFSWFMDLLSQVISFALDYFLAPLDIAFQIVVQIIKDIADPIGKVFDGIKQVFQGVIDFVMGIFTGDWERAWDGVKGIFEGVWNTLGGVVETVWGVITGLFSKGGEIFSGVVDGIAGAFKSIVNTLIDGINKVIAFPFKTINGLLNDVRGISVLGVTPFSFIPYDALPVPQIPMLAKGGIVAQPTLAMIGERGKEAVVPLENNTSWMDTLAQKTASYQAANQGQQLLLEKILHRLEEMSLEVDLDGEVIYRNQEKLRNRKGLRFSNI